ncbi:MAG: hypothetical protein KQH83_06300 [Actinobacteria bacterium]|nr:hypothetical protein [Actinomycetota bacterium]
MKVFAVGVEPVGVVAVGVAPRGVLAVGPLATGVVAIGQLARGFLAVGQLAVGVLAVGQLAAGMWWASGQLALAPTGGPAMLRLAPYGTARPIRWLRGYEDWRTPGPELHGWKSAAALAYVAALAVLVWFVAVLPARDALFGPGGVF